MPLPPHAPSIVQHYLYENVYQYRKSSCTRHRSIVHILVQHTNMEYGSACVWQVSEMKGMGKWEKGKRKQATAPIPCTTRAWLDSGLPGSQSGGVGGIWRGVWEPWGIGVMGGKGLGEGSEGARTMFAVVTKFNGLCGGLLGEERHRELLIE